MEKFKHEMTAVNNEIITHCNSFLGEMTDLEDFEVFIADGINKQLFELMQSKNKNVKLTEDEFKNLMHNIDNLKKILSIIINQGIKEIKENS